MCILCLLPVLLTTPLSLTTQSLGNAESSTSGRTTNLGAIAGSVIVVIVALVALAVAVVFFIFWFVCLITSLHQLVLFLNHVLYTQEEAFDDEVCTCTIAEVVHTS